MIDKIHLLDLYCKAGGCSVGYHRAAQQLGKEIEITGIDIEPQKNYPYNFIQADAVSYLKQNWHLYTHFHASPPCQGYSRTRSLHTGYSYPKLITPTRALLRKTGKPYTMENVIGAPLLNPIYLDGTMFDLRVIRKRGFESNVIIRQPEKGIKKGTVGGKNYSRSNPGYYYIVGGHQTGTLQQWSAAMGIDWMNKEELREAIPPAYTHYIGLQFFQQ